MSQSSQLANTNSDRCAAIRAMLYAQGAKAQIATALPRTLGVEKFLRVAMTAVQREPKLLGCPPLTILASLMQAAQLGLETDPVLGHAFLIPRYNGKTKRNECSLQIGYRGLVALARRSGKVRRVSAHEVRLGDQFSFKYGDQARLDHSFDLTKPRGDVIGLYAEIKTLDGGYDLEVMTEAEVREHQRQYCSEKSDPWRTAWIEMAKKTVLRRLMKRQDLVVEAQRAAVQDEYAEAGLGDKVLPLVEVDGELTDPAIEGGSEPGQAAIEGGYEG